MKGRNEVVVAVAVLVVHEMRLAACRGFRSKEEEQEERAEKGISSSFLLSTSTTITHGNRVHAQGRERRSKEGNRVGERRAGEPYA